MVEFKNIEFSLTPVGTIQYSVHGGMKVYSKNDYEFTGAAMNWLNENYPDAVKVLEKKFATSKMNRTFFHWQIVTSFFACKCGAIDNVMDIDDEGFLHAEFMICPSRFFCKDRICMIAQKHKLTPAETEIMPLLADGLSHKSIGMILKKSPEAVKSTICRACKRFGIEINGKKLVAFCNKKGLL